MNAPLVTGIQNVYPNPFTGCTTIEIAIKEYPQNYLLKIYNIKGEQVRQFNGSAKGIITQNWDGTDNKGNKLCGSLSPLFSSWFQPLYPQAYLTINIYSIDGG